MDLELLRKHVADGIVREQRHERLPLSIFNYSERCQYDQLWDEVTLQCRGLVMTGDRIVARPFRKFFNDSEHKPEEIPWHLPCEVTEKMDGSLLIWFHFEGEWHAATRGSFVSEQAAIGRSIVQEQCADYAFDPTLTYLFEVIYPENRIVLDYGGHRKAVLLAIVETATGRELPLDGSGIIHVVRRLPPEADARALRAMIRDDEEGYVIRFANGFRMKVKGERYIELHRILTGVSSRLVWEYLSSGKPFDELLAIVPDEFCEWIRVERVAQQAAFDALQQRAAAAFSTVKHLPDRKAQALTILSQYRDVSSAAFAALDGKPVASVLWKQLYPEFRKPKAAERIE